MLERAAEAELLPAQFWAMTPWEFALYLRGYYKRKERELEIERQLLAWHAANIMNMWMPKGKHVKPEQLLGRRQATS